MESFNLSVVCNKRHQHLFCLFFCVSITRSQESLCFGTFQWVFYMDRESRAPSTESTILHRHVSAATQNGQITYWLWRRPFVFFAFFAVFSWVRGEVMDLWKMRTLYKTEEISASHIFAMRGGFWKMSQKMFLKVRTFLWGEDILRILLKDCLRG